MSITTTHKGEIPFTLMLIPFLAGLCFNIAYPCQGWLKPIQIAFCSILILFIILNIAYRRLKLYKNQWVGGVIICMLLMLAGVMVYQANGQIDNSRHFSKARTAYVIGCINTEPKLNAGVLLFNLKIKAGYDSGRLKPMLGNLMVSVKTDTAKPTSLLYGDELLIPAKYTGIEPPANPAEFNYKAYLAHQNIYNQTFLIQREVVVLNHNQGNPIIANALKLRVYLVNKLRQHMRDTDAVAVASTIILGYRTDLRKEVQEAYSKTGTMHLLSVAGMHVGLIYFMLSFVLGFLPHYRHIKIVKAILFISLIWCYALITGFSPAVCRAVLMLTMVISASTFNRHINRLNVLAVSAFILLLYNPFYITDAGFQLSYLAVFGIIIIQPYIYKWYKPKNWFTRELWLVSSVSVAAQVILMPIGALYFHDFPVYFLVSNVFIILPSMIVMYAGILYLVLPNTPYASAGLGWLLEHTVTIMTKALSAIEHAPFGSINKIWLTPLEFSLCYILIISIFCCLIFKNKQWLKVGMLACLLIATSFSLKTYNAANTSSITLFSLRKNSGLLFKKGTEAVLITNLTEKDKAWQYSIQPYLDSCKINKLSYNGLDKDVTLPFFNKRGNLIQFGSSRVLILNKASAGNKFSKKLNINYLYLTGSPYVNLQSLQQNYNFNMLIADGSNSKRLTEQIEHDLIGANVNFFNLKRNKAFILKSNN